VCSKTTVCRLTILGKTVGGSAYAAGEKTTCGGKKTRWKISLEIIASNHKTWRLGSPRVGVGGGGVRRNTGAFQLDNKGPG